MIKELPVWMMSEWNTIIVVYYLKELSYGKCHKWRSLDSHPFLSTYATSGHSCFFYRNICREDIKICKTLTFNTITNSLKNQDNTYLKRKMQNIISFIITRKWKHHLEMDSSLFMSKPLAIIGKQTIMFTPHQDSRHYTLISKLRTFPTLKYREIQELCTFFSCRNSYNLS